MASLCRRESVVPQTKLRMTQTSRMVQKRVLNRLIGSEKVPRSAIRTPKTPVRLGLIVGGFDVIANFDVRTAVGSFGSR
jgi:hypothetical protein